MFDFGIEDVKRNNPLPDVMARYGVKVNNKGMAVCPFHNDKNGSMKVYKNNTYFCFGCQKAGDIFDFVQHMEGCDFKTAYHILGGVDRELTKEERQRYREEMQAREREAKRKEAVKKQIFGMETAQAVIERQIRTLPDRRDEWDDGFWGELQKLDKWRLKCELALHRLRGRL